VTPPLRAVPKLTRPGTRAAMIAVATSQVGFREGPNNDTPYGRWYGLPNAAWCAEFVSWAARFSGCSKAIPKHAFTPSGAKWFKKRGQWGKTPKVGALAYYYNASLGRIAHVELVVKVNDDGSWIACGGNTNNTGSRTGNGVYLLRRRTTRGGGFGYPRYARALPIVSASAVAKMARDDGTYSGAVADALHHEGLSPDRDGYERWQKRCGYTGLDADGIAGIGSLTTLAKRTKLFTAVK